MPGPGLVDVRVIPDEVRAPLQSYQRPDGSFVSKPLEDLFPFLPREEFFANMIIKPLPECASPIGQEACRRMNSSGSDIFVRENEIR